MDTPVPLTHTQDSAPPASTSQSQPPKPGSNVGLLVQPTSSLSSIADAYVAVENSRAYIGAVFEKRGEGATLEAIDDAEEQEGAAMDEGDSESEAGADDSLLVGGGSRSDEDVAMLLVNGKRQESPESRETPAESTTGAVSSASPPRALRLDTVNGGDHEMESTTGAASSVSPPRTPPPPTARLDTVSGGDHKKASARLSPFKEARVDEEEQPLELRELRFDKMDPRILAASEPPSFLNRQSPKRVRTTESSGR
jgi:hypothetical protein